jgi:hypothetical protein
VTSSWDDPPLPILIIPQNSHFVWSSFIWGVGAGHPFWAYSREVIDNIRQTSDSGEGLKAFAKRKNALI